MKKFLLSVLLLPLTIGVLGACSSGGASSSKEGAKEDLTTVRIGYMPNFSSVALAVIAKDAGYFEEQGIKPELVEFADGPTIISAMESGSINVGNIGPGAHVLLPQGKAEVAMMDQLGNADAVLGSKKKGVNSLEDLKGKKIAVATGTSSETILKLTLKKAGLTDKDVELMDMDASAITTAMLSGKIDACATWSPNTHTIKKDMGDDLVELSTNADFTEELPSVTSWAIKPGYYKENKDLMVRFEKAMMKAMDYRKDDGSEMAKWVAKQLAVDESSVEQQLNDGQYFSSKEMNKMASDGELLKLYSTQQENFVNTGMLDKKADLLEPKDYVHTDLIEEATK